MIAFDDDTTFARLHFHGGRFEQAHGMPLEALSELAAYRLVLLRVARHIFLSNNPNRERVPKGFESQLVLRLRRVDEGSAVPVVERVRRDSLIPDLDIFDHARFLVNDIIRQAGHEGQLEGVPTAVYASFNPFGKTLRDDEQLLIQVSSDEPAEYSREVRRRIAALSGERYSLQEHVKGFVAELDAQEHRFTLLRDDGSRLVAPFDSIQFDVLHRALSDPPDAGPLLMIDAEVEFDVTGVAERISEVRDVYPAAFAAAWERLDYLKTLQDGWLDGGGDSVAPHVIALTEEILDVLSMIPAPAPALFPTPEGGVQLEWMVSRGHVALELGESVAHLTAVAPTVEHDEALPVDDPGQIAATVISILEASAGE